VKSFTCSILKYSTDKNPHTHPNPVKAGQNRETTDSISSVSNKKVNFSGKPYSGGPNRGKRRRDSATRQEISGNFNLRRIRLVPRGEMEAFSQVTFPSSQHTRTRAASCTGRGTWTCPGSRRPVHCLRSTRWRRPHSACSLSSRMKSHTWRRHITKPKVTRIVCQRVKCGQSIKTNATHLKTP
jgi:hypothetical protein